MDEQIETSVETKSVNCVNQAPPDTKLTGITGVRIMWALNALWVIIVILSFITPRLAHDKNPLAPIIYTAFRPTCHQLDSRSLHICGEKMPVCARCFSIYISLAIFGIIFGVIAHFRRIPAIGKWSFAIFLLPMAIDGGTQALFLRHSTPELRLLTGSIAALGVILFVYPKLRDM